MSDTLFDSWAKWFAENPTLVAVAGNVISDKPPFTGGYVENTDHNLFKVGDRLVAPPGHNLSSCPPLTVIKSSTHIDEYLKQKQTLWFQEVSGSWDAEGFLLAPTEPKPVDGLTVAELIAELQKLDPELPVHTSWSHGADPGPVTDVRIIYGEFVAIRGERKR